MKIIILVNVLLFVPFVFSQETVTASDNKEDITTVKIKDDQMMTTIKNEVEISTETAPMEVILLTETVTSTEKVQESQSSTTSKIDTDSSEEDSDDSDESFENSNESSLPSFHSGSNSKRRKILYLNQQQHGKLNVQFELNDVSLIVVPNSKDPQLSLLDLLLKSAQKSNIMNDMKKKEDATKVNANNEDDYSKYNYMRTSTNEPSIESRAPYRVDISSTLNSQPVVEITHQSEESHVTKSPMLKVKKPIVFQSPQSNKSKRSIENNLVGSDNDVENIPIDSDEDREIINSIEDLENSDDIDSTSEFVLLGATENCGPGRRRNSYQICVAVAE